MSNRIFTNKEILSLTKNGYVKRISEKGITYADEFKSLFIAEHSIGKLLPPVSQDAGFDIKGLGVYRIYRILRVDSDFK